MRSTVRRQEVRSFDAQRLRQSLEYVDSGGIFFPLDNPNMAGGHAATIAWFTPLYHSVKLMRGLAQGPLDWTHAVSAVWILVVSGVLSVIVPRRMRKRMIH